MQISNWKNKFQRHILKRGEDYYYSDCVTNITRKDDVVRAVVKGTRSYRVTIHLNNDKITAMQCSCPYAGDGFRCKHMAAVLYQLEDMPDAQCAFDLDALFEKGDYEACLLSSIRLVIDDNFDDELFSDCLSLWKRLCFVGDETLHRQIYIKLSDLLIYLTKKPKWQVQELLYTSFTEPVLLRRIVYDTKSLLNSTDTEHLYQLVNWRCGAMTALGEPADKIERFRAPYLEEPLYRQQEIQAYIDADRLDEAERLIARSRAIDVQYPGLLLQLSDLLLKVFQKRGDREAYADELLFSLTHYPQNHLSRAWLLKDNSSPEEWHCSLEELSNAEINIDLICSFLRKEQEDQLLLDCITRSGSLYLLRQHSTYLSKHLPDQVLDAYITALLDGASKSKSRSEHTALIEALTELSYLPGGQEAAAFVAQEWRNSFSRKRALMEELAKTGF
ncbi:MAG: SWIM zinc finger family protein [Clostridia bacterium]|nr:SWIM zinc finger family protein [Clostridia bacterium]